MELEEKVPPGERGIKAGDKPCTLADTNSDSFGRVKFSKESENISQLGQRRYFWMNCKISYLTLNRSF